MTLIDIIRQRYSCRSYLDKPIEKEKLDQIFEAARLAPSAKNLQDWRFVVVTDSEKRKQVASATNRPDVFAKAGAIVVACSNEDYVMKCGQAVGPIDISIALEHICLQATELGLSSCWIGSFDPDAVRKTLGIPENIEIIELMTIGYRADDTRRGTDRLPVERIVCYDQWQFEK